MGFSTQVYGKHVIFIYCYLQIIEDKHGLQLSSSSKKNSNFGSV